MRFELEEEHALLKQSVREFLEKEASLEQMRPVFEESAEGFPPKLYAQLAELGYLGLWLPEDEDGAGMGYVGLAAVLEEMGRVAFPGPFLELVVCAELLRCAGDAGRARLRALVAGDLLLAFAHSEDASGACGDPPQTRFRDGRITGRKRFVPFAASAGALLVSTSDGIAFAPRPSSGWPLTALESFDHAQRFADVVLDQDGELLIGSDSAPRALARSQRVGALGAAAMLLGGMERAFEITVDYLKEREAFGAPIGSFQALQHRATEMLLRVESSRAAVYRAGWALDHLTPEASRLVATAKAYAGASARHVCGEAIQMHGGVGFTWEYDPHIFYKRTKTLEEFYGSTRRQLDIVLEESGL